MPTFPTNSQISIPNVNHTLPCDDGTGLRDLKLAAIAQLIQSMGLVPSNGTALAQMLNSSVPQTIAPVTALPLDGVKTFNSDVTVSSTAYTIAAGQIEGGKCSFVVVGDGSTAFPGITGAQKTSSSGSFVTTSGAVNHIHVWVERGRVRYSINQSSPVETVGVPAPAPSPAPSPSPSPAPSPAPAPSGSNPVTTALTGTRTFSVTDNATLDAVPWASLTAGDVVNIYYNATPYNRIIRVHGQGTSSAPIIINGVTDSSGNRPKFNANGASVAAGCMPGGTGNLFNSTDPASWQYRELIGHFAVANGVNDSWGTYRPKWIYIQNLELYGCKTGNTFTDARGVSRQWGAGGLSGSGFRIQDGEDIYCVNNVIYDNDFGVFTMANNTEPQFATTRPVFRNNRLYGNGVSGSFYEHNFYVQAISPIVEGNYIGQVRSGSSGSSYKSRSSGEIFRYNWVIASARAMDFVHSEDSWNGVMAQSDYGVTHCYGNVILNDFAGTGSGAANPIHYGGDNMGEDGAAGSATVNNATLTAGGQLRVYRHTLYFYDNTVIFRSTSAQSYRVSLFALSLSGTETQPRTTVHEWNNAILMDGTSRWSQALYAGAINHDGGSVAQVYGTLYPSHDQADSSRYNINGSITSGTLNLNTTTWKPATAITRASTPSGLPASFNSALVTQYSPAQASNGLVTRSSLTTIGALEP